jgi:hypothetical protein
MLHLHPISSSPFRWTRRVILVQIVQTGMPGNALRALHEMVDRARSEWREAGCPAILSGLEMLVEAPTPGQQPKHYFDDLLYWSYRSFER